MTGRAKTLYEAGLKEIGDSEVLSSALLRGIAVMLDRALPEKKEYKPRNGKDVVTGQEMLDMLRQKAPDAVLWDPATPTNIRSLGVAGRTIGGDILTVAAGVGWWLRDNGLSWMRDKPTLTYIVRNYGDLVARSRESAKRAKVVPPEESALDRLRDEGEI
jgi:hypothetical protein